MTLETAIRIVGALGSWALILVWWFIGRDMNKRLYKLEAPPDLKATKMAFALKEWADAYEAAAPSGKYLKRREAKLFAAMTELRSAAPTKGTAR